MAYVVLDNVAYVFIYYTFNHSSPRRRPTNFNWGMEKLGDASRRITHLKAAHREMARSSGIVKRIIVRAAGDDVALEDWPSYHINDMAIPYGAASNAVNTGHEFACLLKCGRRCELIIRR